MTVVRPRKYQRLETPPPFKLEPDDIALVSEICRREIVDTNQLQKIFAHRSPQKIMRRCRHLFDHGYIARPAAQEELHRKVPGSRPIILTADRRGVALHRQHATDRVRNPKWTQDRDRLSWSYMQERYTTTDTTLAYELSARQNALPFQRAHELIATFAPAPVRASTSPLKFSTEVAWGRRRHYIALEPDDFFALADDEFLLLESDEGTETICPGTRVRSSLKFFFTTSLLLKYLAYASSFRARVHCDHFGIPHFRVLTTTTTPDRVEQIIARCAPFFEDNAAGVNPGLFLFTDRQTLAAHDNNPLAVPHRTLAGKEVYLGR